MKILKSTLWPDCDRQSGFSEQASGVLDHRIVHSHDGGGFLILLCPPLIVRVEALDNSGVREITGSRIQFRGKRKGERT